MKRGRTIVFVLYLLFAVYLINASLNFFVMPEFFTKIDKWILLVSGLFLAFGGINIIRVNKLYNSYRY